MTKTVSDTALDRTFEYIANNGTQIVLCSGAPATFASAQISAGVAGGKALAHHTLTISSGSGDYTIGDGDSSGRKLTVAQQTGINIHTTGTANHVAIISSALTALLLVTSISNAQSVTAGNTATTAAFDDEIADPS